MSTWAVVWAQALVASLWQAPIIAALAWLTERAGAQRAATRHAIRAVALMSVVPLSLATALYWVPGPRTPLTSPPTLVVPTAASTPTPWVQWVLWGWCIGMLLMCMRTAAQGWRVRSLRRHALALPLGWQRRFETLARSLGLRPPAVAVSVRCDTPAVLGVLRPVVLLPAGLLSGVPPEVLQMAICHELMHLRRLDPWLHAAQVAVENVLFFNPAVWWMSRRMSHEREHACDEAVLELREASPITYARALVELEAWRQRPAPALTLGLGGPSLRGRVLRLVNPLPVGPATRWGARLGVVLMLVILAGVFVRPRAPEPDPPPPDPLGVAWLPDGVRRHQDEIARAASRHGVDPGLLAIMVYAESRGRPDARSPVGARGLMQLMPSTAADIAEQRGLPDHAPRRLDEPAYNLDLGAWYMARQLERYDDVSLALAAYNAGPGRVAAWKRGEAGLPEETQRYQTMVMALWAERALPWSPTLAARGR